MTVKKIKSSDILGDNYYTYDLTSSNYTPNLNSSITITCTVKNIYGDIITNKSVQLYQNDVAVGNAKTTNNNGVVTWTVTCSTAGVQKFSIKDNIIEVFVDTTSKTGHNHTTSDITNFPTIPTKTSDLTDDIGFLTEHNPIDNEFSSTSTNAVENKVVFNNFQNLSNAFSEQMTNLWGTLSGKEDKSNKITSWSNTSSVTKYPSEKLVKDELDNKANSSDIPTNNNQLVNGAGYITSSTLVSHNTSDAAHSDIRNILSNKADSSDIPTKTSDLTNDSGYLTSHQDITNKEDKSNKVTSWSSTTTDTHYPSEKLVKDSLDNKANSTHNHTKNQITDFPTIPTKTSDLTNDSNFISTSSTNGLVKNNGTIDTNTYLTTSNASSTYVAKETGKGLFSGSYNDLTDKPTIPSAYTHPSTHSSSMITDSNTHNNIGNTSNTLENIITNIDNKLGSLANVDLIEVTSSLPTASSSTLNKLYLIAESSSATNDNYEIYVTVRTGTSGNYTYAWEKVDTARIDLSGYLTTTNAQQTYVQKETGKGLSSNDYTTTEKNKLAGLHTVATTGSYTDLTNKPSYTATVTSSTTDSIKIGSININGSNVDIYAKDTVYTHPNDLNTTKTSGLYKIALNSKGHVTSATSVEKSDITNLGIASTDLANGTTNGLSSNDYTTTEKNKLANLHTVATSGSYNDLTNKPNIPTDVSQLTDTQNTPFTPKSHNHSIENITNLQTSLNGKANTSDLSDVAFSNDYDDLDNKPSIPTIPTNVSSFTNDSGYLTSHQDISGKANISDLGDVAFSNDYEDLDNTPPQNIFYGTCPTTSVTQTKVVSVDDWNFTTGNILFVKFTNANSYDGTAKISIDGTEKNIVTMGVNETSRFYWRPGELIGFVYDGTNMLMLEGGIASTTYYGATKLSDSIASNSSTTAATSYAVKTAYDLANGKANTSDLGNLAYEDDVDLSTHDVSELTDTNDTAFTPKTHTHDDRYYTESEMDSALSNKADTNDIPTKTSDLTNDGSDGVNVFVSNNDSRLSDARTPTSHTHTTSQITDLINVIYPIGSIYMSVNSTPPSTLFGVGTWVKIEGAFLLASGRIEIDTETYIDFENGDTGGEAIHTLSVDEMPSHTHIQDAHNHTQNSHSHRLNNSTIIYNGSASGQIPNGSSKKYTTNSGNNVGTDGATATNQPQTATNQNTGGGQPHNNMPPYLAVNVWKRTA